MPITKRDEQGERGLPSLNEARHERRRAIVFGRARLPALPPYFWLWVGVGLLAFAVVYWRFVQGELESEKGAVMAKQRAIAQVLGAKLLPFRDRVEGWVGQLAHDYPGPYVTNGVSLERIRRSPHVYLRLRIANAGSVKALRKAAQSSLRDGFTSCLLVQPVAKSGEPERICRSTSECEPGQLCNEYRVCARPTEPYNVRLAYRAMRVLSSEWTDELHQAGSSLAISAYDRDLDAVTKSDVPVAIDLLSRARYFTLVLDEDVQGASAADAADAGETPEERLQRSAHPVRIGIWDLHGGSLILRLRSQASAELRQLGSRARTSQETEFAEQRQANNCALALDVKAAILRKQEAEQRARAEAGVDLQAPDNDAGAEGPSDGGAVELDAGSDPESQRSSGSEDAGGLSGEQ